MEELENNNVSTAKMKYRRFYPTFFSKNLAEIDYDFLFAHNTRVLLLDYDNTISVARTVKPSEAICLLIDQLKKRFRIIIVSNSKKHKVLPAANQLGLEVVGSCFKPFTKKLKKLLKREGLEPHECALIGDQLMTDIAAGNKLGMITIKVEPLDYKAELRRTRFNRWREGKRIRYFQKKNLWGRN